LAEPYSLLKCFEVAIDLKRPVAIRPFEVVEGDTGNRLTVALTDDGEACELDGLRIMAVFSHSKGISVLDSADGSVTADGNVISIELYPSAFAPGMVECELQIYSSTEEEPEEIEDYDVLVTTAKFNFSCRRAILNGESIVCAPQFPLLAETILAIEAAEAARDDAEGVRQQNEEARAAAELTRRLNENERVLAEQQRAQAETARGLAEAVRTSNEQVREAQETIRVQNELARQASENARETAEEARAAAEAGRVTAETARAAAETARAAAETAREAALAQAIASLGPGVTVGAFDPTVSTQGERGRLYFASSTGRLFICSDVEEAGEGSQSRVSCTWKRVATAGVWNEITSFTLSENSGVIEIDEDSLGEPFSYDELRLTVLGTMTGGSTAVIYVNEEDCGVSFSNFCNTSAMQQTRNACVCTVSAPVNGVMTIAKRYGGLGSSAVSAKNDQTGALLMDEPGRYTRLSVEGFSSSYVFTAGTRIILEGRYLE
jgi:hypothetical protein